MVASGKLEDVGGMVAGAVGGGRRAYHNYVLVSYISFFID